MSEETPAPATPRPDDSEAGSYVELQGEVEKHFDGNWENFLKAVRNPSEILYFVLWRLCEGKATKLEAWAKDKKLPADWLPRFYGMLTPEGQFRPGVVTSAPEPPAPPPTPATEGEPQS